MQKQRQFLPVKDVIKGIVYRIRNPLNAIQLNIDTLEGEIDELKVAHAKNIPELFKRIRDAITELDYLLSGALRVVDFPKPQIAPVDINTSVKEVEIFAKPESSEKGLIVKLDLQENLPEIHADPLRVKQVILNVLLNAIEASSSNGSITLATEGGNNHIIVKVIDAGEGIPLAHQDRIFAPFLSTKEAGVGLGLPLVLEILKMHRGHVSFKSEVGKGTTFFISLPVKRNIGGK